MYTVSNSTVSNSMRRSRSTHRDSSQTGREHRDHYSARPRARRAASVTHSNSGYPSSSAVNATVTTYYTTTSKAQPNFTRAPHSTSSVPVAALAGGFPIHLQGSALAPTPSPQSSVRSHSQPKPSPSPPLQPQSLGRSQSQSQRPTLQRQQSSVHFTPDHVFLSLCASDTLRLFNLPSALSLKPFRKSIVPIWAGGVMRDREERAGWSLQFNGSPWTVSPDGREGIAARRLVCQIMVALAAQGLSYLATINPPRSSEAPYLVFASTPPDLTSQFFVICFSRSQRRLTIIDAPESVALAVANTMDHSIPCGGRGRWEAEGVHVFEMNATEKDIPQIPTLMAHMLKVISSYGFRLEATVPMGKHGFLGFGGRREVWVFRSIGWFKGQAGRKA